MKRITIDIFDEEDGYLNGLVEINSNDLIITYAMALSCHGLQCNFDGDTKEYLEIEKTVKEIAELSKKLNKIYK